MEKWRYDSTAYDYIPDVKKAMITLPRRTEPVAVAEDEAEDEAEAQNEAQNEYEHEDEDEEAGAFYDFISKESEEFYRKFCTRAAHLAGGVSGVDGSFTFGTLIRLARALDLDWSRSVIGDLGSGCGQVGIFFALLNLKVFGIEIDEIR